MTEASASEPPPEPLPELPELAHSIAVLMVNGEARAMAFFVAPGLAVTLAHALDHEPGLVQLRQLDTSISFVRIVLLDRELDYAFLQLERGTGKPLPLKPDYESGARYVLGFYEAGGVTWTSFRQQQGSIANARLQLPPHGVAVEAPLPLADLTLDHGSPMLPGSSGAPVLVDGRVVAIAGYAREDGSLAQAVPIALLLADLRVRRLLELPEPPSPELWVAVAGEWTEGPRELAGRLGQLLGREKVGLVTGGFSGIDAVVGRTFCTRAVVERTCPHALRIVRHENQTVPFFDRGVDSSLHAGWVESTLHRVGLLIVIGGRESVELLTARAQLKRIPVVALPTEDSEQSTKPHQQVLDAWEESPLPGVTRDEHAALPGAKIETQLDFVARVLRDLLRELTPAQAFPTLGNDHAFGRDLLKLDEQAKIFARAIVSRDLRPPLAIGLFGDWGAGKSHFMHLIRGAAKDLSRAAEIGDDHDSWPRVCHIEFNAWHYMDADLWVGIAGQIFDRLAQELGATKTDSAEMRRKLRERLRSTQDAKEEAEASVRFAVDRLSELRATIEQLQAERDAKFEGANALLQWDLWTTLAGRVSPDEARKAAVDLGLVRKGQDIDAILKAPEQVQALAEQLGSTAGQTRSLLLSLSPRNVGVWVLGVVVVFGPPLLKLVPNLHLDGATTAVAQAATLVTTIAVQLRGQLTRASQFIEYANDVRNKGELLKKQALANLSPEQKEAVRAYDEAQAKLDTAVKRKSDLEREVSETQDQLDALKAGRLVYDFVRQRSGEQGAYRGREGIVSIVRRDLETLSDLLRQWREDEPDKPTQLTFSELSKKEKEEFPVQRIVLYIDDLDRCPPERVVEVLQAVHLLLAFDLFVVVVGVDARWLERSLERGYRSMLAGPSAALTSRHHTRAASPQDYLEKIFQVPFTLPTVQPDGFRALLRNELHLLFEAKLASAASPSTERPPSEGSDSQTPAPSPRVADPSQRSTSTPSQRPENRDPATSAPSTRPPTAASPRVRPLFHLEPWEREFMTEKLVPFIATPRLIKRFANIYRLLRANIQSDDEYQAFIRNHRDGAHRAVQVMLAANVGFPRFGSDLMRLLATVPDRSKEPVKAWGALLGQIDPSGATFSDMAHCFPSAATDKISLVRLHRQLSDLREEVPDQLSVWQDWSHRVGRYSMYWRSPH